MPVKSIAPVTDPKLPDEKEIKKLDDEITKVRKNFNALLDMGAEASLKTAQLMCLLRLDMVADILDKVNPKLAGQVDALANAFEKEVTAKGLTGFVSDIEKDTVGNANFRKVLYTGKNSQLVLMSLKPGEDIGEEVHDDTDQFFRIDSGSGKVVINGKETAIKDGFAIVVPQGAKHNIINTGKDDLKLYSLYSPPHHEDGTIHKTKEEAEASDEHFDGKTTEGK